ncbi:Fic family protein [Candidatus Saccharibacteria bacterium]|nr:Fic family protein [Candidatus Saccharibacteria bacterium]
MENPNKPESNTPNKQPKKLPSEPNAPSVQLQKILSATGWSQEFLAGKLGVSFVTLNNWINEKVLPREKAKASIDLLSAEILGADSVSPAELSSLKSLAEKSKSSVKKIVSNKPLLKKLTTSLTYHTNGTEGSTMSEQDVSAVVFDNKILKNRTATEQREAINHQTALYFLLDELSEQGGNFAFSSSLVQATHLRLMSGILSDAGVFRSHNVRIRGAFVPLANFLKVPALVDSWCASANEETSDKLHTLARLHADFEKIHPFSDGNGRTGRLLLFIMALRFGLTPPIIRKERKIAYYKYLELAQTRDLTDPLEKFLAEEILATASLIDSLIS